MPQMHGEKHDLGMVMTTALSTGRGSVRGREEPIGPGLA
jgi:hypothetical protein